MFIHPANATALAEEHRQDLTAQARSHRAARTIRRGRFAAVLAVLADRMRAARRHQMAGTT